MSLPIPSSLTPTKVSSFRECALAFKLAVIDKIPQPTNVWTFRGSLAHRVLDRFYFELPQGERDRTAAQRIFEEEWRALKGRQDWESLFGDATEAERDAFKVGTWTIIEGDFVVEDPNSVHVLGTEIMLEAKVGGVTLRGIIDRLDLNPDGSFTITDYKTGKIPTELQEHEKLTGVNFYALLCEAVLGVRPSKVQLIFLKDSITIASQPTQQSMRAVRIRTDAIWKAVCTACEREDFKPRPSRICSFCSFRPLCPIGMASQSRGTSAYTQVQLGRR